MDPRKEKRAFRRMGQEDHVYFAWIAGQYHGDTGQPKRNPYPPGRRHDEYERGYNEADPMGDHHGRNV